MVLTLESIIGFWPSLSHISEACLLHLVISVDLVLLPSCIGSLHTTASTVWICCTLVVFEGLHLG